jgi:hypothetical protein
VRALFTLLLTVCGFFAVEFAIFHTGAYIQLLRHDSSTGFVETYIRNELNRARQNPRQILAIGDSRMGFLPRYANEMKTGYEFASIALGGATPRDWYYMLRGADPAANRYSAVIIALEDYEDSDPAEEFATRATDLYYAIGQLKYSDIPEFSRSFPTPALQWTAARGIVLKGLVYKRDFQEFLLHPLERMEMVSLARRDSFTWYYNYTGPNQSLEGVVVDWTNRTVTVPLGFTEAQRKAYQTRFLDPLPPNTGKHSAYLNQWLGKIHAHYQGSNTRLVFIHLPRGPFVRPDQPAMNPHSSVREMQGVILMPEHLFDSLERPGLYLDQMHLNGPGAAEFSRILAKEVSRTLDAL